MSLWVLILYVSFSQNYVLSLFSTRTSSGLFMCCCLVFSPNLIGYGAAALSLSQHEYQHQLEFTHDGSAIPSSSGRLGRVGGGGGGGEAVGGRGARRGRGRERERGGGRTESTISALNGTGTGARGRLLAVAADRRRAERSLQQGAGQDLLNIHGGDAREAQRTRWVMRMQNEVHQQAPEPERPRAASSRPARAGGGSSPSSSSDEVQLLPSSSLARPSSSSASPSPSICHLRSESEPLGTGRSNTVGIKRVSAVACAAV